MILKEAATSRNFRNNVEGKKDEKKGNEKKTVCS